MSNRGLSQFCHNCNKTQPIADKQEIQNCPVCGYPRTPCSICTAPSEAFMWDGCRKECPYKITHALQVKKWKEINGIK